MKAVRNECLIYIREKAKLLMAIGPDRYRLTDENKCPRAFYKPPQINELLSACVQLLDGRGLSVDTPFFGLSVWGLVNLADFLHFDRVMHITHKYTDGWSALEEMGCRHQVSSMEVSLFSRIPKKNISAYAG